MTAEAKWRHVNGVWLLDMGRFRAEVWEQGGGFPWSIGLRGRGDAIDAPFIREVRHCPETSSLDAAQTAAVDAAVSLLFSALRVVFPWPVDLGTVEAGVRAREGE